MRPPPPQVGKFPLFFFFLLNSSLRVPLKSAPSSENEEPEPEIPEIMRTDADTVKDLVEMKYFPKKKKIRLRTHTQKLFSKKYKVLIEEVCYPVI